MKKLRANILQQLIADSTEPVLVAQIDHPDWPVVLCNDAYQSLADDDEVFPGIIGYQDSVIPQIENAILSGQDIILLGERGQAKSRIIRSLTSLLDEYTPILDGVEIPENPFKPISAQAKKLIDEKGVAIGFSHNQLTQVGHIFYVDFKCIGD